MLTYSYFRILYVSGIVSNNTPACSELTFEKVMQRPKDLLFQLIASIRGGKMKNTSRKLESTRIREKKRGTGERIDYNLIRTFGM